VPGPPATTGVVVTVTVVLVRLVPSPSAVARVPVDLVLPRLVAVRLTAIQLVAGVSVPVIIAAAEAQRVIGTPAGRRLRWLRPAVPGPARTIRCVPVGAVTVVALIVVRLRIGVARVTVMPPAATAAVPVVFQRVGGLA